MAESSRKRERERRLNEIKAIGRVIFFGRKVEWLAGYCTML